MMNDHETQTDTDQSSVIATSKGRRRLIGVGASVAPFLLTLVSQPALGVTCFTPSRSMSRNTSLSQADKYGECSGAQSPGNYKEQQSSGSSSYSWPASVPPTTPMHPLFKEGNSEGVTKFTITKNGIFVRYKTLGEALNVHAKGQVHFHMIGAYLNKMGGHYAVIPDSALTVQALLNMWSEYATQGYYEPFAGTKWHAKEIKNYLLSNGIVA